MVQLRLYLGEVGQGGGGGVDLRRVCVYVWLEDDIADFFPSHLLCKIQMGGGGGGAPIVTPLPLTR